MGAAYIRFALARPGRFRRMFGPALAAARGGDGELAEASGRAFRAFRALLAAAPSEEAALRAWGLGHGLAQLLLDRARPGAAGRAGRGGADPPPPADTAARLA